MWDNTFLPQDVVSCLGLHPTSTPCPSYVHLRSTLRPPLRPLYVHPCVHPTSTLRPSHVDPAFILSPPYVHPTSTLRPYHAHPVSSLSPSHVHPTSISNSVHTRESTQLSRPGVTTRTSWSYTTQGLPPDASLLLTLTNQGPDTGTFLVSTADLLRHHRTRSTGYSHTYTSGCPARGPCLREQLFRCTYSLSDSGLGLRVEKVT